MKSQKVRILKIKNLVHVASMINSFLLLEQMKNGKIIINFHITSKIFLLIPFPTPRSTSEKVKETLKWQKMLLSVKYESKTL